MDKNKKPIGWAIKAAEKIADGLCMADIESRPENRPLIVRDWAMIITECYLSDRDAD